MNKSYISLNGITIASDTSDKGMQQKETHDKIKEELIAENEIEIIKDEILQLSYQKHEKGTIKQHKRYKKILWAIELLFIFGFIVVCSTVVPSFFETLDALGFLGFMLITGISTVIQSFLILNMARNKNLIKDISIIEEQLKFLNNKLAIEKEKLKEIRNNKKLISINDTSIHPIENDRFRATLKERLKLLSYIQKYRKKFISAIEKGTLYDRLFKELELQPEYIADPEETIKRLLQKYE